MKVSINGSQHHYNPNYNAQNPNANGWSKQNNDAFKIESIGGVKVFIKRFQKAEDKIPGYHFLISIKNKRINALPMIYDLVETQDKNIPNTPVFYLFQECIEGKTFEERLMNGNFSFSPYTLMDQLYDAFRSIHDHGYWFTDFVEKNIFHSNDGNFYLIDLDSVAPLTILPNSDDPFLTRISKNYKIVVSNYFYKEKLNYDWNFIKDNLKGNTINYLELFVFLNVLYLYLKRPGQYHLLQPNIRRDLPEFLMSENNRLTTGIFELCLNQKNVCSVTIKKNLLQTYLNNIEFKPTKIITLNLPNTTPSHTTPRPLPKPPTAQPITNQAPIQTQIQSRRQRSTYTSQTNAQIGGSTMPTPPTAAPNTTQAPIQTQTQNRGQTSTYTNQTTTQNGGSRRPVPPTAPSSPIFTLKNILGLGLLALVIFGGRRYIFSSKEDLTSISTKSFENTGKGITSIGNVDIKIPSDLLAYLYEFYQSKGYNGSLQNFIDLLYSDTDHFNYSFNLIKSIRYDIDEVTFRNIIENDERRSRYMVEEPKPDSIDDPENDEKLIDYDQLIQNFILAENERNFESIRSYFSPTVRRYYNAKNMNHFDLERHYKDAWRRTSYSTNTVLSIENISETEYIVDLEFTFHLIRTDVTETRASKVYFKFENDKIVETYGMN